MASDHVSREEGDTEIAILFFLILFSVSNNSSQPEETGLLEEIGEAVEEIRKGMLTRAEMENFRPTGRREQFEEGMNDLISFSFFQLTSRV